MPTWFRVFLSRVTSRLSRHRLDEDFDAEMQAHLALLADENTRRGMTPEDAARAARLKFGGATQMKEAHREYRGLPRLDTLLQDLRYAFRMLLHSPGFTLAAVFTLALGIALNTTVFTVYDSVAVRLLPVNDPSSVTRLMRWYEDGFRNNEFTRNEYEYVRNHSRSFSEVAAVTPLIKIPAQAQAGGDAEIVQGQLVSGNYFSMLGITAGPGRTFLPEEDSRAGALPVAVLSHRFWVRRFLADPLILGKSFLLNGTAFTIVGVAPESFAGTGAPPSVPDLWIPLAMHAQITPRQQVRMQLLGRRRTEVTQKQLDSEMAVLQKALESVESPGGRNVLRLSANAATFFDLTGGDFVGFLAVISVLIAAVMSVLLIGCVNLINLLLARAAARKREIAVRCALGAGRGRIMQQLCTESALLGLFGGAAGLALSVVICRYLTAVLEAKLTQFGVGAEYLFVDLSPNGRVFLYALVISIVTGILVGLAPARQASRIDVSSAMKQESAGMGGRGRFRDVLIAAQIAVCLMLLVGAGLLGRGVREASHADPGFETRRAFVLGFPDTALGSTQAQRNNRWAEVVRRLEAVPQIQSVAFARNAPMLGHGTANFGPVGSPVPIESPQARSLYNMVSPEYFPTVGIPVLRGRIFTRQETDLDAPVVVISEATARRYWPGEDPLGKRISVHKALPTKRIAGRTFTVVGVVKDVRSANLSKVDPAYIYFPGSYADTPALLLRAAVPERAAAPLIRDALIGVDRSLATQMILLNIETGPIQLQRLMTEAPAIVAAVLGALGMLLAAVGIYGVVAYLVTQRTREIGVRVALGAGRTAVLALIFRQSLKPVMWGIPFGLAGAAMTSVLLGKMVVAVENPDLLFGVNPWSPTTFISVLLFLIAIVWLASWMPALRAMRIDPATALRYE